VDQAAYAGMNAVEERHWWFVARRRIIASLIDRFALPPRNAEGVEAGCGTGGNLALLARYGHLEAFEFDDGARDLASAKGIADIGFGALPDRVALPDRSYDLIALLDVLEHIEDDRSSLRRLGDLLRSEGRLILTVPAIPSLWSRHDEIHHHHRRYTLQTLRTYCRRRAESGKIGYFNSLLFRWRGCSGRRSACVATMRRWTTCRAG
jgi:SAM-dependent methyltransferase